MLLLLLRFSNLILQPDANSAALGGAYRARHLTVSGSSYDQLVAPVAQTAHLVCSPNKDAVSVVFNILPVLTVIPLICLNARCTGLS